MLDLPISAVPYSVYVLFNILLIVVNTRLPTSAHKFLLEGKDTLSLVYLDSLNSFSKPLQEHLLLLQALWHVLAESSIFSMHFHSRHKAVQKAVVEQNGSVTTTLLLLPGQSHSHDYWKV